MADDEFKGTDVSRKGLSRQETKALWDAAGIRPMESLESQQKKIRKTISNLRQKDGSLTEREKDLLTNANLENKALVHAISDRKEMDAKWDAAAPQRKAENEARAAREKAAAQRDAGTKQSSRSGARASSDTGSPDTRRAGDAFTRNAAGARRGPEPQQERVETYQERIARIDRMAGIKPTDDFTARANKLDKISAALQDEALRHRRAGQAGDFRASYQEKWAQYEKFAADSRWYLSDENRILKESVNATRQQAREEQQRAAEANAQRQREIDAEAERVRQEKAAAKDAERAERARQDAEKREEAKRQAAQEAAAREAAAAEKAAQRKAERAAAEKVFNERQGPFLKVDDAARKLAGLHAAIAETETRQRVAAKAPDAVAQGETEARAKKLKDISATFSDLKQTSQKFNAWYGEQRSAAEKRLEAFRQEKDKIAIVRAFAPHADACKEELDTLRKSLDRIDRGSPVNDKIVNAVRAMDIDTASKLLKDYLPAKTGGLHFINKAAGEDADRALDNISRRLHDIGKPYGFTEIRDLGDSLNEGGVSGGNQIRAYGLVGSAEEHVKNSVCKYWEEDVTTMAAMTPDDYIEKHADGVQGALRATMKHDSRYSPHVEVPDDITISPLQRELLTETGWYNADRLAKTTTLTALKNELYPNHLADQEAGMKAAVTAASVKRMKTIDQHKLSKVGEFWDRNKDVTARAKSTLDGFPVKDSLRKAIESGKDPVTIAQTPEELNARAAEINQSIRELEAIQASAAQADIEITRSKDGLAGLKDEKGNDRRSKRDAKRGEPDYSMA